MRNYNLIESGMFYPLEDGHVLTIKDMPPGELAKGVKFETNSMLEMWDLTRDGESIGWFFYSAFKVECKGGYLVTFMESRRGKAEDGKLIVRRPEFVMFDIPRCGTLAVSMTVSQAMENILMEQ